MGGGPREVPYPRAGKMGPCFFRDPRQQECHHHPCPPPWQARTGARCSSARTAAGCCTRRSPSWPEPSGAAYAPAVGVGSWWGGGGSIFGGWLGFGGVGYTPPPSRTRIWVGGGAPRLSRCWGIRHSLKGLNFSSAVRRKRFVVFFFCLKRAKMAFWLILVIVFSARRLAPGKRK